MPTCARARARRIRLRTGLSAAVLTTAALGGLLQPAQAAGDPGPWATAARATTRASSDSSTGSSPRRTALPA